MALIDLEDVWKRFRVRSAVVEAVRGLDLHVVEGEIFGFLGPNGAGKSTTVRILATLLKPDQGRARVAGFDLARQPARVRECIGYVGQVRGSGDGATGRAHILFQAHAYGMAGTAARQRMQELVAQFAMETFIDRPIRTYSGGQRRRLDLALGIVHRPKILFLDEPSLGLDPQSRAYLWDEVRRLHALGTTVFLTTHYLEEADSLCDRLAIIDGGKIVAEGTPAKLKQQIAGDVVTFRLTRPETAVEQAQQLLRNQPGVREMKSDQAELYVYVDQGEEALVVLLHLLEGAGIAVQSVALTRPSLDDVFLQQTGRSLREDTANAISL
ncbi:daunorubicin resistance protein DrrA family ABC transporter ATP-binding protein [Dictyobacter alpinus]|uniref:Daunorubicin resistance protein DrrA family ABC transporter ATP-binding protein n=1 Tax=Dictyobacter alpinus TaxID=2014873 RepID=A0A402BJM6_9CHLR|nr:ATP-binding cassette domain-containing protein [Dictyobacter alpinus]GCE31551.1 daunorubicin resistance protein DrrA family ABC transporter ATP-binding protein [Dictyobacter alpinus]